MSGYVQVYAVCLRETEKAIFIETEDAEKFWVPKSQIGEDSEVQGEGDDGTLEVSSWFAEKEGLI